MGDEKKKLSKGKIKNLQKTVVEKETKLKERYNVDGNLECRYCQATGPISKPGKKFPSTMALKIHEGKCPFNPASITDSDDDIANNTIKKPAAKRQKLLPNNTDDKTSTG